MKTVLFALLGLTSWISARAQAPVTLPEALQTVLSRYPTLDGAQAAVDAARARTMETNAALLPQVGASAGYTYLSLRPYVQFSLPSGSSSFYETVQNSYNGGLTVRQLLTDFGRTDALVQLARAGELSAQDALAATRAQLGYETIQAFYGVLLLRESVTVADQEIRALDEALRISQQKFTGGTATKFDLLTTQVRRATSQNNRTGIIASLQKQETLLRQLLGTAPDAPVRLAGDFPRPGILPEFSATIAAGLRQRPEMNLARDATRSADLKIEAADRERRPVIAAQIFGGMENGQLPDMYANKAYATGGLSMSVPLFTGKRIAGERLEARAERRSSQARIDELNRVIATDVSDAFADLRAAQARLENADLLVEQASEALTLARSRYTNGVITNFEQLDAQSAARNAELARLQARYDWTLARQALARAAGEPPAP